MFNAWSSPEAVFQILKELSRGQPCDITGIRDYKMIDEAGGIQWPLPESEVDATWPQRQDADCSADVIPKESRLFENGIFYHQDGKARFVFGKPSDLPESTDAQFPFLLLTGRGTSSQWHTQTRTGKSAVLSKLYPEQVYVEMSPSDAERLGISANAKVRVASRRGQLIATAFITHTVRTGQVFIPMHYASLNQLTLSAFDPYSRQPAYKACAVSVTPQVANRE
jgi:assimilatory nitrate reductase catalytic subunit